MMKKAFGMPLVAAQPPYETLASLPASASPGSRLEKDVSLSPAPVGRPTSGIHLRDHGASAPAQEYCCQLPGWFDQAVASAWQPLLQDSHGPNVRSSIPAFQH